jgi:hypothetical protein
MKVGCLELGLPVFRSNGYNLGGQSLLRVLDSRKLINLHSLVGRQQRCEHEN